MLLNQTDVAVDEELEKVIITIGSSTETDFGDYETGLRVLFRRNYRPSSEIEACLELG